MSEARGAVRIAVIDSGVQRVHPHIDATRVGPGFAVMRDGAVVEGAGHDGDVLGHGTAVTAAIQQWAPDALCIPVRVFHDALRASPRALVGAIDAAVEAGARLINLSLGTTNPAHSEPLQAAARRALGAGAVIVSAWQANDAFCYPGALAEVLGVGLDWDCPRDACIVGGTTGPALWASGNPRPIEGVPQRRNLYGVSFAVANATGFAARAVSAGLPSHSGTALIRAIAQAAAEIAPGPRPS
jgi:Subtilase family.